MLARQILRLCFFVKVLAHHISVEMNSQTAKKKTSQLKHTRRDPYNMVASVSPSLGFLVL